jgi:hypothetical protein
MFLQECHHLFRILKFFTMNIQLLSPQKPFHNSSCPVMKALTTTVAKEKPDHFAAIVYVSVFVNKKLRFGTFKSTSTPIRSN